MSSNSQQRQPTDSSGHRGIKELRFRSVLKAATFVRFIATNIVSRETSWTRCKAKPDCSPPDYLHSCPLNMANMSVDWFACVLCIICTFCRTPPSAECHANPILWIKYHEANKNWLPRRHPLREQKTNFRSFIYNCSSSNPVNLVKIGPVDVENGLTQNKEVNK